MITADLFTRLHLLFAGLFSYKGEEKQIFSCRPELPGELSGSEAQRQTLRNSKVGIARSASIFHTMLVEFVWFRCRLFLVLEKPNHCAQTRKVCEETILAKQVCVNFRENRVGRRLVVQRQTWFRVQHVWESWRKHFAINMFK